MTDTLRTIHDFVNSHWEFPFLVMALGDWYFYRLGYKKATEAHKESK